MAQWRPIPPRHHRRKTLELVFILVEPARAENIGAAARALKTMGHAGLWLVNAGEIGESARWVAHQSTELLDQARHFDTLEQALEQVDFSIATSARRRLVHDRYLSAAQCRDALYGKRASVARAALVFGRESSGLSSDELALCDTVTSLPLAVSQPSLNLAQAVMLYAWELRQPAIESEIAPDPGRWQAAQQQLAQTLALLDVAADENLFQWASEALAGCDDRDLGMLMTLLRRVQQRCQSGPDTPSVPGEPRR